MSDALKYQYEIAAFALLCLTLLVAHHLRRPGVHPRTARGCVLLALGVAALYPAQFLVEDSSLKLQTIYRVVMNVPVVGIVVFMCYIVATTLARTSPRLRAVLLSSAVVLPLAWLFAFFVGLRWPLPALQEATVPTTGVMPAHFLLYKIYLPPMAFYEVACAWVFAREVAALRRALLPTRHLLQNLALFALGCVLALEFLNSYATAIVRVTAGAARADLIRIGLTAEVVLYVSAGLLLLAAFCLYAQQPNFDRLFNLSSLWVDLRRRLEAEIWRTCTSGMHASQEHCLRALSRTPSSPVLFPKTGDLDKAVYCLRLALTLARKPEARASAFHLLRLQNEILKLVGDSKHVASGPPFGVNYDLRADLLHHTVRPAIDISDPKTVPNLVAADLWQQVSAVAFADAAAQASLISHERARLLTRRSVSGTALRSYHSFREYLLSDAPTRLA